MNTEAAKVLLDTLRRNAVSARMAADTYALTGTKTQRVAGTGFTRKGGMDTYWLAELRRKADEAEQALTDLEQMIKNLT